MRERSETITRVECQGCGKEWDEEDLGPLPSESILERVSPGEIMPYGECPDCGAVCHEVRQKHERVSWTPELGASLKRFCHEYMDTVGLSGRLAVKVAAALFELERRRSEIRRLEKDAVQICSNYEDAVGSYKAVLKEALETVKQLDKLDYEDDSYYRIFNRLWSMLRDSSRIHRGT